MRPNVLQNLLNSVTKQTLYPNEIIIVDGSKDNETQKLELTVKYKNLQYFLVEEKDRGLTKQRNIGITEVADNSEVICFLDDDIVLETNYFEELINTYNVKKEAFGVGGYITNEVRWEKVDKQSSDRKFFIDGYERNEGSRFLLRKRFGLTTKDIPGIMPTYSHGRSVGYLPPSGKIYPVEFFMGGVSSYRKEVFNKINFSEYFEGYGLYEDLDFCLRLSTMGSLYVNTNARLAHFHNPSGRPNQFYYGKMVIRNGWYVWRVKFSKPTIKARFKWNMTALLLTIVRAANIVTSNRKQEAFTETMGRVYGWFSLIFHPPKVN